MAVLKLDKISKQFGSNSVLEDIDLETEEDEFVVLFGPSGCGKTTLLRIIAGLETPTEGRVLLDGVDITSVEPKERNISMIFQNYPLYPHLDVLNNIAIPLKLRGVPKAQAADAASDMAQMFGIKDLLRRSTSNLSGGELQRVALAKALIKTPRLFLMDEPLSNLDSSSRQSVKDLIVKMRHQRKAPTVYVTHHQGEAISLADRIAVITEKKIAQFATPAELYNRPNSIFVATSIGEPRTNILEAQIEKNDGNITLRTIVGSIDIEYRGLSDYKKTRILIGIRPDRVHLTNLTGPNQLYATIKDSEYYGNYRLIRIDEVEQFTILCSANTDANQGTKIGMIFDTKNLMFFDIDSLTSVI
jgi:ABC-type sugar transport system ATPase subunit